MRFRKLHERIQALREGAGRVLILEMLEMDEVSLLHFSSGSKNTLNVHVLAAPA